MKEIKAHGNRTLLIKGRENEVGNLLGHVDAIPDVDPSTMETRGDEHHAYALSSRKGKHGIPHYVTRRLGAFKSHEDATAAVKKFHKLDEGVVGKKTEQEIIAESINSTLIESAALKAKALDKLIRKHEEKRTFHDKMLKDPSHVEFVDQGHHEANRDLHDEAITHLGGYRSVLTKRPQ